MPPKSKSGKKKSLGSGRKQESTSGGQAKPVSSGRPAMEDSSSAVPTISANSRSPFDESSTQFFAHHVAKPVDVASSSATQKSSTLGAPAPAKPAAKPALSTAPKSGKQPSRRPATRSKMKESSSIGQAAMESSSSASKSSENAPLPPLLPQADSINQKVIEYLVKKGYNRTEQMLRQESAHLDKDGRPIHNRIEDLGNIKYTRGYKLLCGWVEQNLDVYKASCIP
jgi:hypothetical protein